MKYTVIARTLFDDGKNPYYSIVLTSYPFAKAFGNMNSEEITVLRSEADGKSLTVGTILELVPVH